MKLKEIHLLRKAITSDFKNPQDELGFIKNNNNGKISKKVLKNISKNIIKDEIVIQKYVSELFNFFSQYSGKNSLFIENDKYQNLILAYQQKLFYNDNKKYLEIIGDNIKKSNQVLQYVEKDIRKNKLNSEQILTNIFEYDGPPFEGQIKVVLNPFIIEFTFEKVIDIKNFYSNQYIIIPKLELKEGTTVYNITTKYGHINNIIIYNEEVINQKVLEIWEKRDLDNNNYEFEEFRKLCFENLTRHERQHAYTEYVREMSLFNHTTLQKKDNKINKDQDLNLFMNMLGGEILSFYAESNISKETIKEILVDLYSHLYENLARAKLIDEAKNKISEKEFKNKTEEISRAMIEKHTKLGLKAIELLEEAGYNKIKIINYLSTKLLTKWNLLAKRLIENKNIIK